MYIFSPSVNVPMDVKKGVLYKEAYVLFSETFSQFDMTGKVKHNFHFMH